jgi:putative ATP-binding cassette transporter
VAIIPFLKQARRGELTKIALFTTIAGIANALLIVVVNEVAILVAQGERPGLIGWLVFAAGFALYFQCNKMALLQANRVIERLLMNLRVDVADKLRRSELKTVNHLGRGKLYSLLSHETNHLSITFPILVEGFQQAILLVIALFYLAYLSWAALVVFMLAVLLGIYGYLHINTSYRDTLQKVAEQQAKLLDRFGDIIHGSKELRLNRSRSKAIFQVFNQQSRATEELLTVAGGRWTYLILLGAVVMFAMLGIVVFIFPNYIAAHSTIIFQLVPTMMFCLTPLTKIVAESPLFLRADVGLQEILSMQKELQAAGGIAPASARKASKLFQNFKHITFSEITYHHRDQDGASLFTSGPWDLTLQRGEILFLVGGNGSGKSTALRLLAGLYHRDSGHISVDDTPPLDDVHVAGIRELYAAVFGDFHLFDRLYGLEHVKQEEVDRLIEMMELTGKVKFVDGCFSQLNLSTGQRKRLALIATLLEDRPIYLFDEWAAEQDIHFREVFYTKILPDLKAQGKTVVAVTHDERFWHLADRVIKFDLGAIKWDRPGTELAD